MGCECADGFKFASGSNQADFMPTCIACGSNEAVSSDKSTCMPCDAGTGASYDARLKDCLCPVNNYLVERDPASQ